MRKNDEPPWSSLCALAKGQASAAPGVQLVVLFGSVRRSAARQDSDADIGVLGGDFWQQLQIGSALAAELRREPHVVDLERVPDALAFEIARTGYSLFEAEPFGWAQFQARAALRYFDFQAARQRCAEGVRRRLLAEATRG